jgi:hypothetical protein
VSREPVDNTVIGEALLWHKHCCFCRTMNK